MNERTTKLRLRPFGSEEKRGWALIVPTLLILFFVGVVPFFYAIYISFQNITIFSKTSVSWVGLSNFIKIIDDKEFIDSVIRTLIFSITVVTVEFALALFFANLLMKDFKGKKFFRAIYTIPIAIAPLVVGAIWRLLTLPGIGSLVYYLKKVGIILDIGTSALSAIIIIMLMDIWHWTPFFTVVIYAGLASISKDYYEFARLEGANELQLFRYVSLPMIKQVILIAIFIRLMDSLKILDEVYVLTGGGPGMSTRSAGIHIWKEAIIQNKYSYGAAISIVYIFLIVILCTFLSRYIITTKEGEG